MQKSSIPGCMTAKAFTEIPGIFKLCDSEKHYGALNLKDWIVTASACF